MSNSDQAPNVKIPSFRIAKGKDFESIECYFST